jgi:hypothetical protein
LHSEQLGVLFILRVLRFAPSTFLGSRCLLYLFAHLPVDTGSVPWLHVPWVVVSSVITFTPLRIPRVAVRARLVRQSTLLAAAVLRTLTATIHAPHVAASVAAAVPTAIRPITPVIAAVSRTTALARPVTLLPLVAAPTLVPISVFVPWLFAVISLSAVIAVPVSRALVSVAIVHSCELWRMTLSVRMVKRRTRHSVWSFQSSCCVIFSIDIIASLTPPLRSPFTPIHLQNWRLHASSTKAAAFHAAALHALQLLGCSRHVRSSQLLT